MYTSPVREAILGLKAYVPGKSIAEIKEKYGLTQVIKMASNENPLGTSPMVCEALQRAAALSFRYPQGGNPRLTAALGRRHKVAPERIVVGNGSDEIIDLLLRVLLVPGKHSLVCFSPCFSIYPIQGRICGVEVRRQPLREDFSFDFEALLALVDESTRLVFVTTPDNPSGYCPPRADVERLAAELARRAPDCLLVVDEAYMDFVGDSEDDERQASLLAGSLTLVIVTIPTIIRTTQESLKTVPQSYREAALGLGAGKWHMIRTVVLPSSVDGIVTGCILSVGRIVGESAALLFTAGMGMSLNNYFASVDNFLHSSGASLTVALYVYARERAEFDVAFAIAAILMLLTLIINLSAKLVGKKLKKK